MNHKITELKLKHPSPFLQSPLLDVNELFCECDLSLLNVGDLNADLLCKLQISLLSDAQHGFEKRFVCQDSLPQDTRYYEQVIFEDDIIPTRKNSWHDFFNGLIWFQFPLTKAYLNSLHISEINQHGLNPRTKVRNHLTHFDECGVVLFIRGSDLHSKLQNAFEQQDWLTIFCELREQWHTSIVPMIFGHANLEMLLSPFIGLTAKVLLIKLNSECEKQISWSNSESNQNLNFDFTLVNYLQSANVMYQQKPFFPLPLLGVPNWHAGEQNIDFYKNKAYFMPKRQYDKPKSLI
jgi:hypothetical protein